jgi:hypothetical protein
MAHGVPVPKSTDEPDYAEALLGAWELAWPAGVKSERTRILEFRRDRTFRGTTVGTKNKSVFGWWGEYTLRGSTLVLTEMEPLRTKPKTISIKLLTCDTLIVAVEPGIEVEYRRRR